jgi:hypothetical protein
MATDLFGKFIGGYPAYTLSLHQKRQATMLYHWMSMDYLQGLKAMIDALIQGVSVDLALAKQQGRDKVIANARWGVRDTAINWSTNVYPALQDFRQSTIWHIAQVASETYGKTGAYQCARMIQEHSSMWMTPDEEERFKAESEAVFGYARRIDEVAGAGGQRYLDDRSMALYWRDDGFAGLYPKLPRFRLHTDVEAETGKKPPRSGVYVPTDDANGVLQFAWTGNNDGILGECSTFNALGLRALSAIGRERLWLDGRAMANFVGPLFERGELTDRGNYDVGDERDPRWAMFLITRSVNIDRPCKWYFVEKIEGEFDEEAGDQTAALAPAEPPRLRCEAGQLCPREGWWVTLAASTNNRRHFKTGELMPDLHNKDIATIWYWTEQQGQ